MIIILLIIAYLYLKHLYKLSKNRKFFKDKRFKSFKKSNINIWMNLTKKERYSISKKESAAYLIKRKVLLEEIRKEYKKISEDNSD